MSDSKKPKLSDIRAREQAATEGPWYVGRDSLDCETPWPSRIIARGGGKHIAHLAKAGTSEKDAVFLAHSRTDIPYLLDLVERMGKVIDATTVWCGDDPCPTLNLAFLRTRLGFFISQSSTVSISFA